MCSPIMCYFKSCVIHQKEQNAPTVQAHFYASLKQLLGVIPAPETAQTARFFLRFGVLKG